MPMPERYRPVLDAMFAGRITGRQLIEILEKMDAKQLSFEFEMSMGVQPDRRRGDYGRGETQRINL